MEDNKQFCIGHITKKDNFWFVNFYTCNGRCCSDENEFSILDENTKNGNFYHGDKLIENEEEHYNCCNSIELLLEQKYQSKVTYHDLIYFTILDSVEHPFNNWIGLYAKYEGHVKNDK